MARLNDELLDELDDTIMRLGRIMSARHVGPDCCEHTLTMAQAMLMRALEAHGPTKMSEVASLLGVKPPAASAAVDALEREGYVARTHDPEDRRVTHVHVTDEGAAVLRDVEAKRRAVMRGYLEVLSEQDIRDLTRIHRTLIDAMEKGRI